MSIVPNHHRQLFLLAFLSLAITGCGSKFDRLAEEHADAVDRKREEIHRVVDLVKSMPEVANSYQQWIAAKEQAKIAKLVVNNQKIEKGIRDSYLKNQAKQNAAMEKMFDEIRFSVDKRVCFGESPARNAATYFIEPDSESGKLRNLNSTSLCGIAEGPDSVDYDQACKWYKNYLGIRYLLVIQQVDVVLPEFQGEDNSGNATFTLGAIEIDAHLMDLETAKSLGEFRFVMPGQRSSISFGQLDITLSNDPKIAIPDLTHRLYTSAHEFAVAIAADLSNEIHWNKEVVRDLMGIRLEDRKPEVNNQESESDYKIESKQTTDE